MINTNEIFDLALSDWGEPVTVGAVSISAIYDEPYASASPFDHGVESSGPQISCKTSDLPEGTDHGTAVVVRGNSYTVSGRQDDGLGETTLSLRASA